MKRILELDQCNKLKQLGHDINGNLAHFVYTIDPDLDKSDILTSNEFELKKALSEDLAEHPDDFDEGATVDSLMSRVTIVNAYTIDDLIEAIQSHCPNCKLVICKNSVEFINDKFSTLTNEEELIDSLYKVLRYILETKNTLNEIS